MTYHKPSEIAETLRVSTQTIRRLIDAGELPAVYIGRRARIASDALQRYLEQRTNHDAEQEPASL